MSTYKGTIGILTGGGDVPGLNPAIRAVTLRALKEGYRVLGIRRGWAGIVDVVPEDVEGQAEHVIELDTMTVNKVGRSGGTFLHTSRTKPSRLPKAYIPEHIQDQYTEEINDVTPQVLKNIESLGIDYLIPIGGDDTLSYGARLHEEGVKVVAIPKTMDNDVPGTDYCIGFSTCLTRTIELTHRLRTTAGSHERFLVIEVFGRYAGFTALLPTMGGAANRCVIPEHPLDIELLCELLTQDRRENPSNYSVVLISEGATLAGDSGMYFEDGETDQYGHKKLGGIGSQVAKLLKELSPKYNNGRTINVVSQQLSYLMRSGDPDALDSIVPMVYGNIAFDCIQAGHSGRLVNLRNGTYDNVPIDVVMGKKVIDVAKYYSTERLRPLYKTFSGHPLFIMA
ncbi:6-phosphofructokinase [Gemmatimonadota bacterium]